MDDKGVDFSFCLVIYSFEVVLFSLGLELNCLLDGYLFVLFIFWGLMLRGVIWEW